MPSRIRPKSRSNAHVLDLRMLSGCSALSLCLGLHREVKNVMRASGESLVVQRQKRTRAANLSLGPFVRRSKFTNGGMSFAISFVCSTR